MTTGTLERRMTAVMMILGLVAAIVLFNRQESAWLRVLPWTLVFGYPLWQMYRTRRAHLE